ncbi:MAG: hypothetical protein K8R35_09075 [Bacteroidales bacterium]|nr:hypothetical protein [Bacteroidales bacterium]
MIPKIKINPGKQCFIRVVTFIILISFPALLHSQHLEKLTLFDQVILPGQLSEISGIVYHDGTVYAINDSWNQAVIYTLDFGTFQIVKSHKIHNLNNKDWEEIAIYKDNIYIGDFGNNFGNRRDLSVYSMPLKELGSESQNIRSIRFKYKNQVTYSGIPYNHPWDCEAMVVDSAGIWLFSKDRESKTCSMYKLPHGFQEGQVSPVSSFNTGFIVTGAFYNSEEGSLYLVGYGNNNTYIVIFNKTKGVGFSPYYVRYIVPELRFRQVESIFVKDGIIYLASERTRIKQRIYMIKVPQQQ